jgi:pantoate--beta-alanine ligase
MTQIVRTPTALREIVSGWRQLGHSVAFVPTMGALHEGHLDLVRAGKQRADKVVTSIFVNPTQFAAHEDLGRYPRDEAGDTALLGQNHCDLVYAPDVSAIFPDGFSTQVIVNGITSRLEGAFRPHFFAGVATVVAKLFLQVAPDYAIFGEKDWQQLQVVTKLAKDLGLPLEVHGVPTRRETDGLAMSSRNAYLTPQQRQIAPAFKQVLDQICAAIGAGQANIDETLDNAKKTLIDRGFTSIDYLAACHTNTLEPWRAGDPLRVLGAAWLGQTRLIDNRGA